MDPWIVPRFHPGRLILGDFVSIRYAGTSSKRQAAVVQEMAVMQRKKSWLFLLTLLLIVLLGGHLWWRGRGGSKVIWFKVRHINFNGMLL